MKEKNGQIKIPLSKVKISLLFLGALGFVTLGTLFILNPESYSEARGNSDAYLIIVGIVAVLFFGVCAFFIGKKIFDTKAGLIIDDRGIIDNSNATSIGLIEWEDIQGLKTVEIASTKILMLITNQPEKYISRARNGLAKRAMKANLKMYGSPLSINSNALQIKYKDLEKLIAQELEKRPGS